MFNYHNRQFVFKMSNGEIRNFFCDSKQNLCCNTLTSRGTWSNASVLFKNAHHYFYADMDQDDTFHLLYQDYEGYLHYSRMDGQTVKSVPVLNSRAPAVYNKQLFLAPFKNNVYFFYVLQHENSFILAYQILSNNKIGSPRVVDYVSGSSLPCVVTHDKSQNIYAFYQSYDGKYLQLGYKKLNAAQKSLSEFTPITKYSGNCEYPHVMIDDNDIIHLCYQRRAPKFIEMVYQQKAPDKNLWTNEEIVHSSVHSFESASILQEKDNIVVFWIRDDSLYYNSSPMTGNNWSKAVRHSFSAGRQLQCLSCKSSSSRLPPVIYPGTLSNGLKLAFSANDFTGEYSEDVSQLFGNSSASGPAVNSGSYSPFGTSGASGSLGSSGASGSLGSIGASGGDIRNLVLDAFKQLQHRMDEVREGSSATRDELARLRNSYDQLNKELMKYSIRLNLLESQLGETKKQNSKLEEQEKSQKQENSQEKSAAQLGTTGKKTPASLDPEKLKEWEEWQEPEEWQEG